MELLSRTALGLLSLSAAFAGTASAVESFRSQPLLSRLAMAHYSHHVPLQYKYMRTQLTGLAFFEQHTT